jgi:hypothetical protein
MRVSAELKQKISGTILVMLKTTMIPLFSELPKMPLKLLFLLWLLGRPKTMFLLLSSGSLISMIKWGILVRI